MRLASFPYPSDERRATLKRRALPFLLVLIAHILIVIALLTLAPRPPKQAEGSRMIVFQLAAPKAATAPAKRVRTVNKTKRPASRPSLPVPPPATSPNAFRLDILDIDLKTSDISKLPSYHPEQQANADSPADSAQAPGTGPHGEKLYNAQWQTEPTDAELAYYLPQNRPAAGFGLIACKTVPRFRVEDCVALGETPGSGLAQAVLDAAWQFRVLPPRIGGRALVGEWVRIRIDYSSTPAR